MTKRKIEVDIDDSSDEELVNNAVENYSLQKKWKKFCEDTECKENDYNKKLPFIAHAFGIGLLYSEPVANIYYGKDDAMGLKAKYLASIITPEILKDLIDKALLQTLKMFYNNEDKFQEVKNALKIEGVLKAAIDGAFNEYNILVDDNGAVANLTFQKF